ncbi:MAG TPA: class I SAM-dependent RNA methyltransferase [Deltaproteobacteria bacterium]|nr:class I SAM-dependent RNA methyltransferase [Deltaproteobacteria bacterium]
MTFTYQKNHRFFAQVADGMEDLGREELISLGAQEVKPTYRGIYFSADQGALYRINYTARIITRVLAPLLSFDCHSTKYLYKTALTIPWSEIFSLDNTFVISANVSNSKIRHSQYATLVLKDAVVDSFRQATGSRPDVARIDADICFNLHISNNKATIYLDTSGGSLHRRGYRRASVDAPMQETLAAAIIHMSEWDGCTPLYDPMCGSGTLLCEAYMHYCNIPSGYFRKNFGFTFMPEYDQSLWKSVKKEEGSRIKPLPKGLISGSDASSVSISAAQMNMEELPNGRTIVLKHQRFEDLGNLENTTIVCNPPYGHRMKTKKDIGSFMKAFGNFLKQRCTGSVAYIYFGNRELIKEIGLRSTWKKPLKNGQLDGRLVKYELF